MHGSKTIQKILEIQYNKFIIKNDDIRKQFLTVAQAKGSVVNWKGHSINGLLLEKG